MTVLLDEVVHTDYGQFTLLQGDEGFDGDADRFFAGQTNGWVGAAVDGVVHVVLARRSGGSQVRIELHDGAPALGDAEDIVEVSLRLTDAPVGWEGWAGEPSGVLEIPPGTYRVRVSARGRDAGQADEFADHVVDWYLIELWPDAMRQDEIVRSGSQDAADWHASWGSRRED